MRPVLLSDPKRSLAVKKVTVNIKNPPKTSLYRGMYGLAAFYVANFPAVHTPKKQTSSKASTSRISSTMNPTKAPVFIDLTTLDDDSDMDLESNAEDEPSAPPLLIADIGPPPESARFSAERLTKEEQEDHRDEDYLERMLLVDD